MTLETEARAESQIGGKETHRENWTFNTPGEGEGGKSIPEEESSSRRGLISSVQGSVGE